MFQFVPPAVKLAFFLVLLVSYVQSALVPSAAGTEYVKEAAAPKEIIPPSARDSNAIDTSHTEETAPSVGSDLMDSQKLAFLSNCNGTGLDARLCDLYRELSAALAAQSQKPITAETIEQILAEKDPANSDQFCENLTAVLKRLESNGKAYTNSPAFKLLADPSGCVLSCLSLDLTDMVKKTKPICRVLLWGFRQQLILDSGVVNNAANALIPPLLNKDTLLAPVGQETEVDPKSVAKPIISSGNSTAASASPPIVSDKSVNVDKPPLVVAPTPSSANAGNGEPAEHKKQAVQAPEQHQLQQQSVQQIVPSAPNKSEAENLSDETQDEADRRNSQNIDENNKDNEQAFEDDTKQYDEDDDAMGMDIPTAPPPQEGALKEQQAPQLDDRKESPKVAPVPQEQYQQDPGFFDDGESNFFSYFLFAMFACIVCYVGYHNKSKVLALVLEGRRSSSSRSGFSKGGRKHTAAYRKLDSNLEEAITSNAVGSSRSTTQIIY